MGEMGWGHAARPPEPACPDGWRYPSPNRGVLTRASRRDGSAEVTVILTPRHRGPTGRGQRASPGPIRTPLPNGHRAALYGSLRHPFRADMIRRKVTMKTQISASGGVGLGRGGRLSRQRKRDTVLRMLRGEDLETLSRALGVTAATLTGWQDTFVAAGEASLAS